MSQTKFARRGFLKLASTSIALAGASLLAACGGGDSGNSSGASGTAAPTAPPAGSGGSVNLSIESIPAGSRYNTEKLEAPAGSKITLTFKNGTTEVAKLYNWVLVKPNSQMRVVNNALEVGPTGGYVKEGDPDVIVHTKLLKGGESDTITFDAPAPGVYPFVCTAPGVVAVMKGTLTIK